MFWLALFLALGTTVAIAYPLFRPRSRPNSEPASDPAASELAAAKEATYAAIKELEFDYRAGSLSHEDYQDLEARYKRKATTLLQAEDAHQSAAEQRAKIEAEIRRLRARANVRRPLALRQALRLRKEGESCRSDSLRKVELCRTPTLSESLPTLSPDTSGRLGTQGGQGERVESGPLMVSLSNHERQLGRSTAKNESPAREDLTRRQAIENAVRRLRGLTPQSDTRTAEDAQIQEAPGFCTQCGSAADPEDRFCAHCGHPLSTAGRKT